MLVILIILVIIIIIDTIIISIIFSDIVINIEELDISYNENDIKKLYINKLKISVNLYVFNFLRIIKINVYKDYIKIFNIKIGFNILQLAEKIKKFNYMDEKIVNIVKLLKDNKDIINTKNLKPRITKFNLNLSFGTKNPLVTTFSLPAISAIISILLSNSVVVKFDEKNIKYQIFPVYVSQNTFEIIFDTKFKFSVLRLLFFIYEYKKAKSVYQ